MKYAALFSLLGLSCLACAFIAQTALGTAIAFYCALAALALAAAYGRLGPPFFRKNPNGVLSRSSYILFGPYLLFSYALFHGLRWCSREPPFHEVLPNLYLGRRLTQAEALAPATPAFRAVLDLTSEFTEPAPLRSLDGYLCIPLLDATAPTTAMLLAGVEHIRRHLDSGPVFVHCAMGHGRSAAFVIAFAALSRKRPLDEAEADCSRIRPGIRLHKGQRRAIQALLAKERAA